MPMSSDVIMTVTRDIEMLIAANVREAVFAEHILDIVAITDADATLTWVSPSVQRALGHRPDELCGRAAVDLIHPDDVDVIMARFAEVVADPSSVGTPLELRVLAADGTPRWYQSAGANRLDDPVLRGIVVSLHDVDSSRVNEIALRESELRTRGILEMAGDAIITADETGVMDSFNRAAERIYRLPAAQALGRRRFDLLPAESFEHLATIANQGPGAEVRPVELTCRRADGEEFPAHVTLSRAEIEGHTVFTAIVRDITPQKGIERELERAAWTDDLTGLPNRAGLLRRLDAAFVGGRRAGGVIGVLHIDLDGFNLVNGSLGHASGDRLLELVARRIHGVLDGDDVLARIGSDEFAVMVERGQAIGDVRNHAYRITNVLREPFEVDGQEIFVTASIGVSLSTGEHDAPVDLLRHADTAMHRAKTQGRGQVQVFDDRMQLQATTRFDHESALQLALGRGELRAHYQPIVHLPTDRIVHREALMRWERPDVGLVSPSEFIEVAEETGLIVSIGAWMIRQATADCVSWQHEFPGVGVSVNVSARQLEAHGLSLLVRNTLAESGLAAELLTLEVTESLVLGDADRVLVILNELRDLGVRIALDDFGTGYSSLTYLRRLPIDELKIDQEFLQSLEAEDAALMAVILELGRARHVKVVAEGVDSAAKLAVLRELGCESAQGFLLGFPEPLHSGSAR